MSPSCSRIRRLYRTLCWGTVSISLNRMIPIGWLSLSAFSIWTCRSRSLTSTSILLVRTDFLDTKNSPVHAVAWGMITRVDLSDAVATRTFSRAVRPPRHGAVARLAGAALPHGDDADRHGPLVQAETLLGRRLCRPARRQPVAHELGKDPPDDLLSLARDGHRALGAAIDPPTEDPVVAG